jgi:hypothetical protein
MQTASEQLQLHGNNNNIMMTNHANANPTTKEYR